MTLSTLRPAGGQAIGADFQKQIGFAETKIQYEKIINKKC